MCKIPNQAVTHAGRFHADDVFSTALLRILNPQIQVQRVPQLPEGFAGLAFDIGWGEFDHHQQGAPVRADGVPYAACGLLWRPCKIHLCVLSLCTAAAKSKNRPLALGPVLY